MTPRTAMIRGLLRLYPAAWRHEYGDELADVLRSRPLTTEIVLNVLWHACRHQVSSAAPSTTLGVVSMLVVVTGFIPESSRFGYGWTLLQPTSMTLPTIVVSFMASEPYVLMLLACGFLTRRRDGEAARPGIAAMRMSLITGSPVVIAGLLFWFGAIDATFTGLQTPPSALAVIAAPLMRVPQHVLWVLVGSWLARRFTPSKSVASAS